jgi:putative ABC transport system permease protein
VGREIAEERRQLPAPEALRWWRRRRLDLALLGGAAIAEVVAVRSGALEPPAGSVYSGVAISLSSGLLVAPLLAWVGGVLVGVRVLLAVLSHLPAAPPFRPGAVVRGIRTRSLRRRPWALATGITGLGLVMAFGTNLAIFGATYDGAKAADARFVVGADLRITPSVVSAQPTTTSTVSRLVVPGVTAVSPVVFARENSVLIGPFNQGATALAAIDAATFARVALLPDEVFVAGTGAATMSALAADPDALLVDAEAADDLGIEAGDDVEVILALGSDRETQVGFRVVGLFERLPGFPEGVNVVANLSRFQEETGLRAIDFVLADVAGDDAVSRARAIAALRSGPGGVTPLRIETPETALSRDQSSLTALNVNGLADLGSLSVLSISAAVVAIFVFGLLLQRRREYVTMRALGAQMREVRALVLGEGMVVAAAGLAAGVAVGTGVAVLLVGVLRGLFILEPAVTIPAGRLLALAALVVAATVASGVAASEVLRRLAPSEILREE